jgi:uncharacterized repeat protein (TIGR01451 family)
MFRNTRHMLPLVAVVLMLLPAAAAFAAGTPSGTTVTNSATVDFRVGGVVQPQIASNAAQFVVDNRIDLTVTTVDVTAVTVAGGSTDRVLTYLVTNTGNTTQDFRLQALDAAAAAFGLTETFDAANVRVYVDANGNGVWDPATESTTTWVDELAADASVHVFVVADMPATLNANDVASYDLLAIAATAGGPGSLGGDAAEDNVADDPAAVQIVFGDGAGQIDAAEDGQYSSRDSYLAADANLTVTKASVVADDPFNGATNPKAIPGARVTYTLDVANTGTGAADNVSVVDAIPAFTVFRVGSVVTNGTVLYSNDGGTTWTYTPTADADGNDAAVTTIQVTYPLVAGGGTTEQTTFDVVIQ